MSKDQPNTTNPLSRPSAERPGAPALGSGAGDGFLSSLTDLESRINAIKQAHEQAAARDLELGKREGELAAREQEIAERERFLSARAVKAEAELVRAQREQEEAAEARAALEKAAQEFATREQEHREHEFDLKRQADDLERDRASVAEHARTLAEQMKQADQEQNAAIWSNRMESTQMELGEANAARAGLQTELAQCKQDMESLTQELIEANQSRGVPREEVEKRDKVIAELTLKVEEARATATMLQQQVQQAGATATTAREQQAREAAEREANARASSEQLAASARELENATKQLADRTKELAATVLAAQEQAQRSGLLATEVASLKSELGAARELLDQAEAAAKTSVSAEDLRAREATIAGLEQALREADRTSADLTRQEKESAEAMVAELTTRLHAAEHAAKEAAGDVAESLTAQIHERDNTIAELRSELSAKSHEESSSDADAVAEIAKRDEAITILKERLDEAMAQARSSAAPVSNPGPTDADYRRRDRLRQYKTLLRTQARKIMSAQDALARRHADCELVLQSRAKLAALAQQLARAEKKNTSTRARSGAAAAVLYMTATLGVLSMMSWEVSKRVWPGTYIAKAIVEADIGRRTPKTEDLAAWQKDHADLLSDPRLMEVAAQRMQQRGLTALGSPGELAARMKQDMYVQSSRPGSLTVELRGEGAEKTALVLDTFVTAYKSVSDQARDERTNDIGLNIAQAATAGTEPLMDKRLEKAAEVFAGAALAAMLAGLVIWSRMVSVKRKFDQAALVEAALGDVDWAKLESSIKQNPLAKGKDAPIARNA